MNKGPATARLDRLLANMGYGSRREIAMMAGAGWITLDGVEVRDVGARLSLTPDLPARLLIRKKRLDPLPGMAIMIHKPLGVTCSRKEAGGLIYDLLPDRWRAREPALSTVGRLDKETSGLLLMTDDGDLLHRIISPKSHVPKRYVVTLDRPLTGTEGGVFASGDMMLEGEHKPLLPAELTIIGECSAFLTVHEGRYHQVRRMFAALGNHVTALHRDIIGGLTLPGDLAAGQIRIMGNEEIMAVFGRNESGAAFVGAHLPPF
jgi:16S rRNA pseudouridine516 synthase